MGSGTALGNGYFLTAAHVIKDIQSYVVTDDGLRLTAYVVSYDKTFDIAIVRVMSDNWHTFKPIELKCSITEPGTTIRMHGSFQDNDFVMTQGIIAGTPKSLPGWKMVYPVDGTVIWGMSGGAATDLEGRLIGVNVGIHIQLLGLQAIPMSFAYVVPSHYVCGLVAHYGFDL